MACHVCVLRLVFELSKSDRKHQGQAEQNIEHHADLLFNGKPRDTTASHQNAQWMYLPLQQAA